MKLKCVMCGELIINSYIPEEEFEKHYTVIDENLFERLKKLKGKKVLIVE